MIQWQVACQIWTSSNTLNNSKNNSMKNLGQPETGLWVLHIFCHLQTPAPNTKKWSMSTSKLIQKLIRKFESEPPIDGQPQQVTCITGLGHKFDIAFMLLSKDPLLLRKFQSTLAFFNLTISKSYLSLTEISEYAEGVPDEMKQMRLYPTLPDDKPVWCFYPMSKARGEVNNWFTLPFDKRKELMHEHGTSGRKFSGRVIQVITGSTGIDDFEWGVTLFCDSPETLKEVVYTLRFDEASAKYAEFGSFYVGLTTTPEEIYATL